LGGQEESWKQVLRRVRRSVSLANFPIESTALFQCFWIWIPPLSASSSAGLRLWVRVRVRRAGERRRRRRIFSILLYINEMMYDVSV
jgi:hypothetical protein